MSVVRAAVLAGAALAFVGCLADSPVPHKPSAPTLGVQVAALSLSGVGDVVWDVEVVNGAAQIVWQRRLTSSAFGDGAGSASYVGPCDATSGAAEHLVKLWVVGVYGAAVTDAGRFNSGSTADDGAVVGSPLAFESPTALSPLTRAATCSADTDVAVRFDVALLRPAQQGFFDVAVSFDDIFCSAKFDCAANDLLHDATGARAATMVLGFACTAGPSSDRDTVLYLDDLELDCTAPTLETFAADVALSPVGAPGNQCVAGAVDGCPAVATADGVAAAAYIYQLGVYRGVEQLTSGGVDARKVYWNVALGVHAPAIDGCRLRTRGTAAATTGALVTDRPVEAGAVYPFVQWDVALGDCGAEALTFGDPTAPVRTAYTTTAGDGVTFGYGFGPSLPARALCEEERFCGGACVDIATRVDHCGACDNVCGEGEICSGGACGDVFEPVVGAALATAYTSNEIALSGFDGLLEATVTPGAALLIDGVEVSAPATIAPGAGVSLRATSPAAPESAITHLLTTATGGVWPWTLTTRDTLPANLAVTPSQATGMDVTGPGSPAYGAVHTFTVTNDGELPTAALEPAVLSDTVHFELYDGGGFGGDGCEGLTLAPGEQCTVDVRPRASAPGALSGILTVGDGALSVDVTLSGTASSWSCPLPWGGSLADGDSVTAYQAATTLCVTTCPSEVRTCNAGTLSGSYPQGSCSPTAVDVKSVNAANVVTCRNDTTTTISSSSLAPTGGHCGTGTFDWRCEGLAYHQVCFYGSICGVTLHYGGASVSTVTQCRTANGLGHGASYCTW